MRENALHRLRSLFITWQKVGDHGLFHRVDIKIIDAPYPRMLEYLFNIEQILFEV